MSTKHVERTVLSSLDQGSIPCGSTSPAIALAKAGFLFYTLSVFWKSLSCLMYYTYILLCSNGEYYKGCTNNIEYRLLRHQRGYVESTKDLLPVKLITYTAFTDKSKAFEFEKYLKSGSGRAFLKKHLV